jgi:hypothetical protein
MTPFLQQVATAFYRRYSTDLQRMAFVFPNRRAGVFFRKYLSQAAGRPIFSPAILTINGLFLQLSRHRPADRIHMLFLLYRIYIRRSGSDETFDDFIFWGDMLLNDFDDVDKHLVDARRLFANIGDLHDLDSGLDYLSDEQIRAIRSFWSSFRAEKTDANQQQFLSIWKLLHAMYTELRDTLAAAGQGYEGMIFRDVLERIRQEGHSGTAYEQIVFVGLNAISPAEHMLLTLLRSQGIADFYWDGGSDRVRDPDNRASHFLTALSKEFPSALALPAEEPVEQHITLTGIPSRIGQAKHVCTLLNEITAQTGTLSAEQALRTAIVLPDEQLLIPVLNSIPMSVPHINVTLGYPLAGTPVATLTELIQALQKNLRTVDGRPAFHHRETLALLNHHYVAALCPADAAGLIKDITIRNQIHIAATDLHRNPLLTRIFSPVTDAAAIPAYLIAILEELNRSISALQPEKADGESAATMQDLEQEFIYHYHNTLNRLKDLMHEEQIPMAAETFFRLLKRLTQTITIPFHGEPLAGLQVMGLLETRVLDFDRLIILSMNEGIFPLKQTATSFIPYNLRRGFGLPTHEHQDSIWAYHFYRLISRAAHVHLLYDTRTDGARTGEASRYIQQLKYHYEIPLREQLLIHQIAVGRPPALQVNKSAEIMQKLDDYLQGGDRALSASTLNMYLDCPLKFFFTSVEKLGEEDEITETVENRTFGNILHKVIERLYQPLTGALITADLLRAAAAETTLTREIQRAFAQLFFHSDNVRPLTGQNYLTGEMIRKYILKILEQDRRLTPFRYIRSEKKMQCLFRLTDGRQIQLKGFIDRLDEINGTLRVVDYKTGIRKPLDFKTIPSLFDPADEKRQSAIMQVFMYAWMHGADTPDTSTPLQPVVYYVRELFSPAFDPVIYIGKEKNPVTDFIPHRDEFENHLRTCLDRLFHPAIPFTQTVRSRTCTWCPFAAICGK